MKTNILSLGIILSLQSFAHGNLLTDIIAVIGGTAQCSSCPSLLAGFKEIAASGDESFVQLLTIACVFQVGRLHLLRIFLTVETSLISTRLSVKAP